MGGETAQALENVISTSPKIPMSPQFSRTKSPFLDMSTTSSGGKIIPVSPVSAIRPWAHAVQAIQRKDLVELKSFKNPPAMCNTVLCAVCWLLTGEGSSDAYIQAK